MRFYEYLIRWWLCGRASAVRGASLTDQSNRRSRLPKQEGLARRPAGGSPLGSAACLKQEPSPDSLFLEQLQKLVGTMRSRSPPIKGRGGGGVCNLLLAMKILTPPPTPASPHRRYAPQLLPPRNCLQGRGAAAPTVAFGAALLGNIFIRSRCRG